MLFGQAIGKRNINDEKEFTQFVSKLLQDRIVKRLDYLKLLISNCEYFE